LWLLVLLAARIWQTKQIGEFFLDLNEVEVCPNRMKQCLVKAVAVLIEEDTDMRWLMRFLLENAGVEVVTLQGDSSLVERLNWLKPDVILIDLHWPPSERLALIRQLSESGAPLILALVMDTAQEKEALRVGATAILRKPDDVRILPEMIDYLIQQSCVRWIRSG
jgi:DNA-binding response OmpR family regulator